MTALLIVLSIFALLLLLLLIPVRLSLSFRETLSISVSYLFLRFPLYPREKEVRLSDYTPRKLRKRKRKLRNKRRIEKVKEAQKSRKNKKTLEKKLRQLRLILAILKHVYKNILSAVHLRVKRFYVTVATDDAAKTAILYGIAAQSTSYLLALLKAYTKTSVKRGFVDVVADFCGKESTLDVNLVFSITPCSLLLLGIRTAFLFLKQKQPDKNKDGEKNHE